MSGHPADGPVRVMSLAPRRRGGTGARRVVPKKSVRLSAGASLASSLKTLRCLAQFGCELGSAHLATPGVAVRATSWRQVMHRRPVDNVDSRVRSQTYGLKKNCTAFSAVRGSLVPEFQIQTGAPARGSSCCSATRVHRPAAPSCWISSGCGGCPFLLLWRNHTRGGEFCHK